MILIPEQVTELSAAIDRLKNISAWFQDPKASLKIKEYENILKENDYLKKIKTDRVSLGSKINLYLNEIGKFTTVILVDNITNVDSNDLYVKKESLIGRSIYGKEISSSFSIFSNNIKLSGKIFDISSSSNNFIMNRPKSARICKDMEKYLRLLRKEQRVDELRQVNMISKSQYQLLLNERDRLTRLLKREESINFSDTEKNLLGSIYSLYSRLGLVNKMIEEIEITKVNSDDIVEVGNKVTFTIRTEDKFTTKTLEFINHAVSDELDTEYVEGISPLGYAIYHKSVGDVFSYKNKENVKVEGIVCNIEKEKILRK